MSHAIPLLKGQNLPQMADFVQTAVGKTAVREATDSSSARSILTSPFNKSNDRED